MIKEDIIRSKEYMIVSKNPIKEKIKEKNC